MAPFEKRMFWLRIDELYNKAKRASALLSDIQAGPERNDALLIFEMIKDEIQALQIESQRIKRDLVYGE